jgi:hypothetical protein
MASVSVFTATKRELELMDHTVLRNAITKQYTPMKRLAALRKYLPDAKGAGLGKIKGLTKPILINTLLDLRAGDYNNIREDEEPQIQEEEEESDGAQEPRVEPKRQVRDAGGKESKNRKRKREELEEEDQPQQHPKKKTKN